MLGEPQRLNDAKSTIPIYMHTVEHFSRRFDRSHHQLGPEHIRQYQAALFYWSKLAWVRGAHSIRKFPFSGKQRFGYNAALTNMGRFPDAPELKRYRVTAAIQSSVPNWSPRLPLLPLGRRAYITSVRCLNWLSIHQSCSTI